MKSNLDKARKLKENCSGILKNADTLDIKQKKSESIMEYYRASIIVYDAFSEYEKALEEMALNDTAIIEGLNDQIKVKDKQIADFKKLEQGLCNTIHGYQKDIQDIFKRIETEIEKVKQENEMLFVHDTDRYSTGYLDCLFKLTTILSSIKKDMVKE